MIKLTTEELRRLAENSDFQKFLLCILGKKEDNANKIFNAELTDKEIHIKIGETRAYENVLKFVESQTALLTTRTNLSKMNGG